MKRPVKLVVSGQWPVAGNKWSVASGQRPVDSGQWIVDSGRRSVRLAVGLAPREALPTTDHCSGFTLIEILVATAISLLLLSGVIVMFGNVSETITESRSLTEMAERLRLAQIRLQQDLAGVTVTMNPPRKPGDNEGYFEYIEGPAVTGNSGTSGIAQNTENSSSIFTDPTVGDFDDILMFTTRSTARPFVGKFGSSGATIQSDVAEVAWFVRGQTLHRRVLLVAPGVSLSGGTSNYYINYDVSARPNAAGTQMTPNTLGDLTLRENRYAHSNGTASIPWCWTYSSGTFSTLPTLNECSSSGWLPTMPTTSITTLDLWANNTSYYVADNALASGGTRTSDDIILTNVIGFDVKAWDPHYTSATAGPGAYVNLGYGGSTYSNANANTLAHFGASLTATSANVPRVYDTWSTTYLGTAWNNGLDDNSTGIVDNYGEISNLPPYPVPLRGIQVKIRVFEPDSKQIREVTVVQDFLP